ncbi:MAG: putative replicase protein [Perrunavirus faecivivens]|uniref:RNA-directed RNA polymerase n=1 Tax=Leviviridae sp. TaxID=2027243 RepID=A0ABY3SS19_9VIRU|nr:MAG: putative replicase protein [Leviviridae sp.]
MATKHPSISRNLLRNTTYNEQDILHDLSLVARATSAHDPNLNREGYLTASFLSKFANPSPESRQVRSDRAVLKLLETEERNKRTIERLRQTGNISGVNTDRLLFTASRFIADVLGECDLDSIFRTSDFSNGASTSRKRRDAAAIEKFDGKGDVTLKCLPYLNAMLRLSPCWRRSVTEQTFRLGRDPIRIVEGNAVFTVPKNDDIDRAAAKEPDINMFFQKAVGNHIRSRLKLVRIDLNDQGRNKELARLGSIDGSLATLDLSSASDSVTWKLVEELLPYPWFKLLTDLRSERGFIDGVWHEWATMSTMGNGFTFELESLIFWALAKSAAYFFGTPGIISVYGDDIIVPVKLAKPLMSLLGYCGFIVNPDKSFWTGGFRESCGGHYLYGQDITPFYCKTPLVGPRRLIWFLNQLRKWSGATGICDPRYEELYFKVHSKLGSLTDVLKGGRDLGSDTELVTPHQSGKFIHEDTRMVRTKDNRGLTYWLKKAEVRDGSGESHLSLALTVSERMKQTGKVSLRNIPRERYDWHPSADVPVFLREIG